jgi:Cys-tRNA(Pro)/Cys-tRNA(Cys) deacylase
VAAAGKTNAVRLLDHAGVIYRLLPYDLAGAEFSAEAVASSLGLPAGRVFKTLAARSVDAFCLAVVPGDSELDLKALARAAGERRMEMVPVTDLRALTGYQRGSVTALGTKRPLDVYLDQTALEHATIAVSAGAEGLQVLLTPEDYMEVTGARLASIARRSAGR